MEKKDQRIYPLLLVRKLIHKKINTGTLNLIYNIFVEEQGQFWLILVYSWVVPERAISGTENGHGLCLLTYCIRDTCRQHLSYKTHGDQNNVSGV